MKAGLFALVILAAHAPVLAIQPGQWQTSGRMTDIDITLPAGMPAGMVDMMKKQMLGKVHSMKQCITQSDIDDAPEKMFQQSDGQCSYEKFDMSGGKLDAVAVCRMEQGMTMRMTMTGTHNATSFQSRMVMTGDGPTGPMRMINEGTGTRIGDC